jgi:hypothetical protein
VEQGVGLGVDAAFDHAGEALADLAADRVNGAAVLRIGAWPRFV